MALNNYTNLKASIADWVNRSDIDSQIVDFISLAEARIAAELKTNELHTTTTLSVDAQTESLPDDYAGMVRADFGDQYDSLSYVPPDLFHSIYSTSVSGQPVHYTIEGNSILFSPSPDTTYTLNYTYIAKPDLATDDTNRLLVMYPGLYLYGALAEAYAFLKDVEEQSVAEAKYKNILDQANESDQFKGPLQIAVPGDF